MNDQPSTRSQLQTNAISTVIATGGETNGMFALVAVTLPAYDAGRPLHSHLHHVEGCYVIDGTLAFTQDTRTTTLTGGTSALIPPGVSHTYWNPTATPTTILLIYRPGVREAAALALAAGAHDIYDTS